MDNDFSFEPHLDLFIKSKRSFPDYKKDYVKIHDMGWHVEVNTVLRLGESDVDVSKLKVGERFNVKRQNIRIYIVDIPILLLAENWKVIGYCAVRKSIIKGNEMLLEVELITLFNDEESKIHTECFETSLRKTGYKK